MEKIWKEKENNNKRMFLWRMKEEEVINNVRFLPVSYDDDDDVELHVLGCRVDIIIRDKL